MREFEVEFEDGTSTAVHAEIWQRSDTREDDPWEHEFHTPHREGEPNAPEPAVFPASVVVRVWEITRNGRAQLWPKVDEFPNEGIKVYGATAGNASRGRTDMSVDPRRVLSDPGAVEKLTG